MVHKVRLPYLYFGVSVESHQQQNIGETYGEFRCLHGAVDALLLAEHGMPTLLQTPKLSEPLKHLHVPSEE